MLMRLRKTIYVLEDTNSQTYFWRKNNREIDGVAILPNRLLDIENKKEKKKIIPKGLCRSCWGEYKDISSRSRQHQKMTTPIKTPRKISVYSIEKIHTLEFPIFNIGIRFVL